MGILDGGPDFSDVHELVMESLFDAWSWERSLTYLYAEIRRRLAQMQPFMDLTVGGRNPPALAKKWNDLIRKLKATDPTAPHKPVDKPRGYTRHQKAEWIARAIDAENRFLSCDLIYPEFEDVLIKIEDRIEDWGNMPPPVPVAIFDSSGAFPASGSSAFSSRTGTFAAPPNAPIIRPDLFARRSED